MQVPALLFAILLAGGNPVWDRQPGPGQAQICSDRVAESVAQPAVTGQTQKTRRLPACPAGAKPLAEAKPVIQTR